jgi:hypothetical protein
MDPYQEKLIQEKATQSNRASGLTGASTKACDEPAMEMLTQRFRSKLQRSKREQRKSDQMEELLYLLDKNPEVARILDLIDTIGDRY